MYWTGILGEVRFRSFGASNRRCEERGDEAIFDSARLGISTLEQYYVYLLSNYTNSVIYTGVTNDLKRRVYEHRDKLSNGFTKRYQVWKLVYYEVFEDIENAILREKQMKAGPRIRKIHLIEIGNPRWRDLYTEL